MTPPVIKRRTNVVGLRGLTPPHRGDGSPSLPNDDAIIRLVGAILIEHYDEWAVSRRYMTLETLARWGHSEPATPPEIAAA